MCKTPLSFAGTYKFHEGRRYGFLGNTAELFVKKRAFDVYECPKCGKVELYSTKKK
ncbi:MAG: hypothetical protein LBD35_01635 [Prevotellaceae bacterium]|nr:hypothetical protein [Prevotellaceae bacterium]